MIGGGWGSTRTIVAGADLSGQQYKFINESGVLATSATNPSGILQNKPQSGEHATVQTRGISKVYMTASVGVGAFIGQSGTTSGGGAIVTSGGHAFGKSVVGANSGGIAAVDLFGAPAYIAL